MAGRKNRVRAGLIVILGLLALVFAGDRYPGTKLEGAKRRAKAAGMMFSSDYRPKKDPENAGQIYFDLVTEMKKLPAELLVTDFAWPPRNRELAQKRREWMSPSYARVREANTKSRVSFASSRPVMMASLGQLVTAMGEEAFWLAEEGKPDLAIGVLRDALTFYSRIYSDPMLTHALVADLLGAMVEGSITALASYYRSDPILLAKLAKLLGESRDRFSPRLVLSARTMAAHDAASHGSVSYSAASKPEGLMRFKPVQDLVEAELIEGYTEMFKLAPDDVLDWPQHRTAFDESARALTSAKSGVAGMAAALYFPPNVTKLIDEFCDRAIHGKLLRLAIQIAARRKPSEEWPSQLDAQFAAEVDPWSGHSFKYKPVGDGFVVYSVGVDGKDDGGKKGDVSVIFPVKQPS